MSFSNFISKPFVFAVLIMTSTTALAEKKNLCVFDLLGANGPTFSQMKDYKTAALNWGVELILKPYTSEHVATEDFKSGLCDAVSFTGIRSRQFNPFTGSLDAIGALPSYEYLKSVISTISSEKAAKLMVTDPYEVVGIFPMGSAYLFVNDRTIDTVGELAGKRIAILDVDPAQIDMVKFVGASPVGASIADMYSKFNNGSVDITFGPALVYEAMELNKGLEPHGGIIHFPIGQLTMQIVIQKDKFPAGFGQKSRDYVLSRFDQGVELVKGYEGKIPEKFWVSIPQKDMSSYNEVFRQARIRLRDKGIYNGKMLTVMRRLRCEKDPQMQECSASDKE